MQNLQNFFLQDVQTNAENSRVSAASHEEHLPLAASGEAMRVKGGKRKTSESYLSWEEA